MSGIERIKPKRNGKLQGPPLLTRKEFLKEVVSVAGGIALVSLAPALACTSPGANTSSSVTGSNTGTTTNTTISLPPADGFVYKTPTELPPMVLIPGCTSHTALDRKYTIEHMWVKMVAENIAAIGITEKMSQMVAYISTMNLPQIGRKFAQGDVLLYVTSSKLSIDLIAPVSGTVLQQDTDIFVDLWYRVNSDPYVKGWLITMQLNQPEEWNKLLTPQEYTDLNAKVL